MPRQIKEIRNFNLGTILNLSEKDIPEDAAAYSLNVDPLSENGILLFLGIALQDKQILEIHKEI